LLWKINFVGFIFSPISFKSSKLNSANFDMTVQFTKKKMITQAYTNLKINGKKKPQSTT